LCGSRETRLARAHQADVAVTRMLRAPSLRRRGPDHRAMLKVSDLGGDPLGAVGATRLAITDRHNRLANMPLASADGRLVIVFNGQIYNHRALRAELAAQFPFRTHGDTEVILAAYDAWGDRMFEHFEGMYAFCLVDRARSLAILAIDHAGQKPLYWYRDEETVLFASDIDTILHSGAVPFELDVPSLQELIVERYIRDERTHLRGLHKLLNGTFIALSLDATKEAVTTKRHFRFVIDESRFADADAAADAIGDAILESDKIVVQGAEVRPVFLLSSGIDSSSLVALASRHSEQLATYTLGFDHSASPGFRGETAEVREFLAELRDSRSPPIQANEVTLGPQDFPNLVADWIRDAPHLLYNRDALFLYRIFSRIQASGARTAVTGCGPDEIFEGYGYGLALLEAEQENYPLGFAHYAVSKFLGPIDVDKLLWGAEAEVAERISNKIARVTELYSPTLSPLQKAQLINWHTRSQYECLKSDIAASVFGIEGRKPHYTRALAERAFQFPATWKHFDGEEKWIFRRALARKGILAGTLVRRAKRPFPAPLGLASGECWTGRIADVLCGRNLLRDSGAIDFDVATRFLAEQHRADIVSEMLYAYCLLLAKQRGIADSSRERFVPISAPSGISA
jgi:asparagine synthase (glutamine-hydrolysing)